MAEGKRKFIEDAARVIDGRVAALRAELEVSERTQNPSSTAADRAAIAEAEHCARLIRSLLLRPYHGHPYSVAIERWSRGEAI